MQWRHLLSTVTVMFVMLLAGILQGVELSESVYSIMPQWWPLMVLQYVAASFHLPSVSTANISTVQYTKPHQECDISKISGVVVSKLLPPQSNVMSAFDQCHSSLFSDVSSGLPTYTNHNITEFTFLFSKEILLWKSIVCSSCYRERKRRNENI